MKRRLLSLVCALIMVFSLVPLGAIRAEAVAAGDGSFIWPVATKYPITCGNYYSSGKLHGATDFGVSVGTSVHATAAGTVIVATDQGCKGSHYPGKVTCSYGTSCAAYKANSGSNGSYANWIIIDHHNGMYSLYAHLQTGSFKVGVGSNVAQGQQIANSGNAGNSSGPHLHFEIRVGSNSYNSRQDPQKYLTKKDPSPGPAPAPSCTCSESYAGQYICTAASLNLTIRNSHSASGAKIGSIPPGAEVTVTKASGNGAGHWAHVTYNGVSGYASMEYLQRKPAPAPSCTCSESYAGQYRCTTSSLNLTIRDSHSASGNKIGSIPTGAEVTVTKASGNGAGHWAHVSYGGVSGYASMEYLSKIPPAPVPTQPPETQPPETQPPAPEHADTPNIHYWIADSEYGDVPDTHKVGNRYYFCYRLYDPVTGKDWDEVSDNDYVLHLTFYNPDGSVKYTNERTFDYDRSWISSVFQDPGTYRAGITLEGDFGFEGELSFYVEDDPKQIHASQESVDLKIGGTETVSIQVWTTGYCKNSTVLNRAPANADNSVVNAVWGEWNNGKIPLTITAKSPGTVTLTLAVKEKESGKVLDTVKVQVKVEADSCKLTYDANGGTGAPAGVTALEGDAVTVSRTVPSRSGYTFLGWSTDPSASSAKYVAGDRIVCNADITLYAVWSANTYKVTYNANGGTGEPETETWKTGESITVSRAVPKRAGYTFKGWATSPTAAAAEYTGGDWISGTRNLTLYAVWEEDEVYVTGISVYCRPDKREYEIGESLDTRGLLLTVTYSNGTVGEAVSGFTTSGFESNTPGIKTVTVTYKGKTATFTVTVNPPAVQSDAVICVSDGKASAGDTVEVTISLKNNPGIASMKLKVAFGDMLTLTSVSYNSQIGGQPQQPQQLSSPVSLNWVNATADAKGDWVFATLTFKISENARSGDQASVTVTYEADNVYNLAEENVTFSVQPGTVTVSSHLPGDINGDGKVNNKDATRLLQHLSDWDVEVVEAALDINGDGKVNNKDATRLLQYLSDWDVEIY